MCKNRKSPINSLLNIVLDMIIKKANLNAEVFTKRGPQMILAFADDIYTIGKGRKLYETHLLDRTRNNAELEMLYHSLKIIKTIKSQRLRWTGHVRRFLKSLLINMV